MGDTKRGIILDVEGSVELRPLSASPRTRVCASHGAVLGRQRAGTRWLSPLGAIIALQRPGKEVFTSGVEQPRQRPSSR